MQRWHLQTWWQCICFRFNHHWLVFGSFLVGEVQKEERQHQGTYLVRCGNTDSDLLSYNTASTHDSKAMSEIPYETGSCYIFDRAYNKFSQLFSINQIGAYFVVRAKKNVQYKVIKWKRWLPKNVLSDCIVEFTEYKAIKDYPKQLRLVRFFDEEQEREFVLLKNATHISSSLVAELYKNRWQIELFFKWLKQHLKIKKFGVQPRMPSEYKSMLSSVLTCWLLSSKTIWNLKEVHTKSCRF